MILTRQFRFPVFINGHDGYLIETAAGLLDNMAPEKRIKAEVEEETGFRVSSVQKVFEAYMSPGSVTEKLYFTSRNMMLPTRQVPVVELRLKEKISKCLSGRLQAHLPQLKVVLSSMAKPLCCFTTSR